MTNPAAQKKIAALERQVFRLGTLLEVSQALSESRDGRSLFANLLAILAGTLGVTQAAALIVDEHGHWQCAAGRGALEATQINEHLRALEHATPENVLLTMRTLLHDGNDNGHTAATLLQDGAQVVGAIVLGQRLLHQEYEPAETELLQAVGRYATQAMQKQRLYETLQQLNEKLQLENLALREGAKRDFSTTAIIGKSETIHQVLVQIRNFGRSDANILITGETGTGKELVARALHYHSRLAAGPFLGINCTAVPEHLVETEFFGIEAGTATGVDKRRGLFEQAQGGTLFIDEVGDMPPGTQAKLLRVLQERALRRVGGDREIPVNVRVIAATNQVLVERIRDGRFREDLYYRLAVLELQIPALRERREDISLLANHFLAEFQKRLNKRLKGLSIDLLQAMEAYDWPGNVRELENEMERMVALAEAGQTLQATDLSPKFRGSTEVPQRRKNEAIKLREAVNQLELEMISDALARHNGNKSSMARELGVSRLGLQHKMDRLGISLRNNDR